MFQVWVSIQTYNGGGSTSKRASGYGESIFEIYQGAIYPFRRVYVGEKRGVSRRTIRTHLLQFI